MRYALILLIGSLLVPVAFDGATAPVEARKLKPKCRKPVLEADKAGRKTVVASHTSRQFAKREKLPDYTRPHLPLCMKTTAQVLAEYNQLRATVDISWVNTRGWDELIAAQWRRATQVRAEESADLLLQPVPSVPSVASVVQKRQKREKTWQQKILEEPPDTN